MRRAAREFSPARYGVCIIGWRDENEEKGHCWRLINCPFDLFPRGQMTPITGRRRIWVGSGCRLFRPRPSPSPRSTATPCSLFARHATTSPASSARPLSVVDGIYRYYHQHGNTTATTTTTAVTATVVYTLLTCTTVFFIHPPKRACRLLYTSHHLQHNLSSLGRSISVFHSLGFRLSFYRGWFPSNIACEK